MHSANLHLVGCLYRVKPCSMQHQVLLMYRVVSHLLIANCVNSKIQRAGVGYKITKNTGRKCSPMYENSCLCVSYIFGPIVELNFVSHVIHVTVSCDQLLFAAGWWLSVLWRRLLKSFGWLLMKVELYCFFLLLWKNLLNFCNIIKPTRDSQLTAVATRKPSLKMFEKFQKVFISKCR